MPLRELIGFGNIRMGRRWKFRWRNIRLKMWWIVCGMWFGIRRRLRGANLGSSIWLKLTWVPSIMLTLPLVLRSGRRCWHCSLTPTQRSSLLSFARTAKSYLFRFWSSKPSSLANIYPMPLAVKISSGLALSDSNFSRKREICTSTTRVSMRWSEG
jgi:hypothetical protein